MPEIRVLDARTIDLIAAGEVVERPASVVKELVENALDAGATAITVEIKDGGIGMIRITDNGCGMSKEQIRSAFLRHATSKIRDAEDLDEIRSLGFRGEALSSIAAVSNVELITKTSESLTGVRYCLDGAVEKSLEEIGAPDGTTFIMRNLFYNTPVRKKFLKQAVTEGGYVTELMEHLALSRPDVSFRYVIGNQPRFHTSGNGDLREVIYRIHGREIANAIIPIQSEQNGMKIEGYLGKPTLVRSNRSFEIYFINGRFIKSNIMAKALEEGYKEYLMQHKFPYAVLHVSIDPGRVDVNVHPTKMDVRFWDNLTFGNFVMDSVRTSLKRREMIPQDRLMDQREIERADREERTKLSKESVPESFENQRMKSQTFREESPYGKETCLPKEAKFEKSPVWERVVGLRDIPKTEKETEKETEKAKEESEEFFVETTEYKEEHGREIEDEESRQLSEQSESPEAANIQPKPQELPSVPEPEGMAKQLDFFEEKMLTSQKRDCFQLIGQVFDTYWMFEYENKLCILDQHAAHEKVKYERFMKQFRAKEVLSQELFPPVVISLSGREQVVVREYREAFANMGFGIEDFGGNEICLRRVPVDLYGCEEKDMFLSVLDELDGSVNRQSPRIVEEKIATMACKAAVKGNTKLSRQEAEKLIDELLTLDNPYNCPHGRPTIITISKYEMEKKFKRIV